MTPAYRAKMAAHMLYSATEADCLTVQWLNSYDIRLDAITNLVGPVCRHAVTFFAGGRFEYDPFGEQAFCIVLMGEDAETELDILAWSARDPETFGTLLGQAGLAGATAVTNPASYTGGKACPLWRAPLDWLRAGCEGACVLDLALARPVLARAPGLLLVEDFDHAQELHITGALQARQIVMPEDAASRLRRAA